MKKLILLLILFPFLLISCSDDDDVNQETLNGTTWIAYDSEEGWYEDTYTIKFTESKFELHWHSISDDNGDGIFEEDEETHTGNYTYNYPKVTLTLRGKTEVLTISGNKMVLAPDEDGFTLTFTKK